MSGRATILDESIPEWDAAMALSFSRHIKVNVAEIREQAGLPQGTRLRTACSWHCETTTLRGSGTVHTHSRTEERVDLPLEMQIPAGELAGLVTLTTSVILGEALDAKPLRARRVGSILWEDAQEVVLEGGGGRFPMEAMSFSESDWQHPDRAAWMLGWGKDFDLPVLGGLHLMLNLDHPKVKTLLERPEDVESRILSSTMFFDVGRQLVYAALRDPLFVERTNPWLKESVGAVVDRLLRTSFRGESARSLSEKMKARPEWFDAYLQAQLGAWWS